MPRDRALCLFAKAPVPGRVKTRLAPEVPPRAAAHLYEAMLLDVLDAHARSPGGADLFLWYSPPEARAWFAAAAPPAYRLAEQRGRRLGERMARVFRTHAREGYARVVLRGTDSPTLPLDHVDEAFGALSRTDLVLGPDPGGGYNLIGLREPCDGLFEVETSTPRVLEATLERARKAGLDWTLLPGHRDVDTAGDLEAVRGDLSPALTPRTLAWFRRSVGFWHTDC